MSANSLLFFANSSAAVKVVLLLRSPAVAVVMFVKSAFMKYRLLSVLLPELHPPISIKIMHTNDAMVSAIGVKMHAMRPALPIAAVFAVTVGEYVYWRPMEDGR